MKIAYWVFCASKHNKKCQTLTFGEIHTIRFSNFNRIRIRILFGFGKSGEYEYEYIRFWKIIRIRIRILFGLKISAEYEYEYHYSVSTIRILFKYRIIRSRDHLWNKTFKNKMFIFTPGLASETISGTSPLPLLFVTFSTKNGLTFELHLFALIICSLLF